MLRKKLLKDYFEYAYGSYNQLNLSVSKEALNNFDKFDIKIGARLGASIDFNSIKKQDSCISLCKKNSI